MNATEGVFLLNRDTVADSSASSAVRAPAGNAAAAARDPPIGRRSTKNGAGEPAPPSGSNATVPIAPAGSSAERLTSRLAAAATAPRAAPASGAGDRDGGCFEATRGGRDAECVAVGSSRCAVPSWLDAELDADGAATSPRDAARTVARRASRDAARGIRHVGSICSGRAETVSSREDGEARRGAPRGTPRGATRARGTTNAADTIMFCSCVTVRPVVNLS
jgi:hypothetical protein